MKKETLLLTIAWLTVMFLPACNNGNTGEKSISNSRFDIQRPVFPDEEYLITDFGAINDGVTLNTPFINDAIRECSKNGGGTVIIPDGLWITGPIQLLNNVNLHVDDGALVLFTRDFDEYPYVYTYFEGKKDFRAMPLLFGDSLENIAITGKGVFDGSGDAWRMVKKDKMTNSQWEELIRSGGVLNESETLWWPNEFALEASRNPGKIKQEFGGKPEMEKYKAFFRPPLVQLVSCNKVLLDGPLFENSPGWCIHPLMCNNLTVTDITVRNDWFAQNGDGIDVESCTYVSITNSQFDVGDDAICLKSGRDREGRERGMPTQFVEVENCIVHHGHGGFVVGSEMSGGVKDIWVQNCTFTGTDVGLRFKSTRGRGGVVENIHIKNIRMINIARDAIIFNLFYAGLAPTENGEDPIEYLIDNAPDISEETPEFRNIYMSEISCHGGRMAMNIMGLPEMPVNNITLEKSVFTTTMGISCLFTSELAINDVTVNSDRNVSVSLNNVSGAEIKSISGTDTVILFVDGERSSDIIVKDEDIENARKKTQTGEKTGMDVITFTKL